LGGQLWSLYLSANPGSAHALAIVACCNVHYKGWPAPYRYGVLAIALSFRALGMALGYVPAGRFGFAGTEARTVITDWSENCRTGNYRIVSDATDYESALAAMPKPVLAISFAGDRLAPRASVENLLAKMKSACITRKHLSAPELDLEQVNHFNWSRRPEALRLLIREWIDSQSHLYR
jgi:predicted alpha/beta hydrolase